MVKDIRQREKLEPEMIDETLARTIDMVFQEGGSTLVLYQGGTWRRLYGSVTLPVQVPEWNDLTDKVVARIGAPFAPGFQMEREFLEPLWTNVTSGVEDWYEEANAAHDMERDLTEDQKARLQAVCINRMIGALEMLFYGNAVGREYI